MLVLKWSYLEMRVHGVFLTHHFMAPHDHIDITCGIDEKTTKIVDKSAIYPLKRARMYIEWSYVAKPPFLFITFKF